MSDERREGRLPVEPAEWATFAVAAALVLTVIGLILAQMSGPETPPSPSVAVGEAVERSGQFVVPVSVTNGGDATAENVQVIATLTLDDGEVTADQVVDFLAGGEEEQLEFVFEEDPDEGELDVSVGGYTLP